MTVEMEMRRHATVRNVSFHRSRVRSDARLTYREVDEIFAGRARAEEPWADGAGRGAARCRARCAGKRDALEIGTPEPSFEFDADGHVTGVRYEAADGVAPPDRAAHDPGQRAGGRLPGRPRLPTLYRVHERPDPPAVAFLCEQLASLDVPTPPRARAHDARSRRPTWRRRCRASWPREARAARTASAIARPALAQAGLLLARRTSATPGSAAPRYCHFTSPIRRYPDVVAHRALLQGLGIDQTAAPRARAGRGGRRSSSATEREAMQIERDADDVCLAFLLERRWPRRARRRDFEGEVVGPDREGRLRALRRGGLRGPAAGRGACAAGGRSTSWARRS